MKRILQITGLFALLPVGAIVTMLIVSIFTHRYDDRGTGMFHGVVSGRLFGQESFLYFSFEGETEPRWHWARPKNYRYKSLELEWQNGDTKGTGVLDLSSFVLTTPNGSFALTKSSLAEMLRPKDDGYDKPTSAEINEIYSLLTAAGQGNLPRPRHHHHPVESPLHGSFAHFSLGWRLPYAIYAWFIVWVAIVIFISFRYCRSKKSVEQDR